MDLWSRPAEHGVDGGAVPQRRGQVETQHTFVNQFVGILTLGIYTPMQIRVTCAARESASADPAAPLVTARGTSATARQEAFTKAVTQAAASRKSVYLQF